MSYPILQVPLYLSLIHICCASCKALYTAVIQAVSETGIEAKVVKVEELTEIMKYNVMSMPALVIDGKVVSSGRKPTVSEVKKLLVK